MYQESVISAITDIPPLVETFAATAGWTVAGTSDQPILTRPGGGLSFELDAAIAGNDHTLTWTESGGSTATEIAKIISPRLNGTVGSPDISIPSKVHLFGDTTPEAFLAIVVEYGFNSYRHLYLGNMEKASAYTGGEVISGTQPYNGTDFNTSVHYRRAAYLFSGFQALNSILPSGQRGGVHCAHANNPTPWRKFFWTDNTGVAVDDFVGTEVIGGYMDDINDGYLARAKSSFAAAQILVPINLYAPMPIAGDCRFAPLGAPAGIRMVHMEDIDPGYQFTIGAQDWRCFPAWKKHSQTSVSKTNGSWPHDETSYWIGYAYPEN